MLTVLCDWWSNYILTKCVCVSVLCIPCTISDILLDNFYEQG